MDTSTDDLINLRERILEQAIPLLDTDDIPVDERFRLTLQMAQTRGTADLYEKALGIAQSLEGDAKVDAYLELLAGVDAKIQEKTDIEVPDEGENQDQEQNG